VAAGHGRSHHLWLGRQTDALPSNRRPWLYGRALRARPIRALAEVEWDDDAIGVHHVREVLNPSEVARLLETPGLAWRSRPVSGCAIYTHALRVLAPLSLRGRYFLAVISPRHWAHRDLLVQEDLKP
jgi:hypothetical protein